MILATIAELGNLYYQYMKYLFFFVVFIQYGFGQSFNGTWKGDLKAQGMTLPFVVHLIQVENGYEAKADSPKQGAFGLAAKAKVTGDSVVVSTDYGAKVVGVLTDDTTITSIFFQGGIQIPLILKKQKVVEMPKRPQEPQAPFSYDSEDFVVDKDVNTTFGGTITSPKQAGKYPAVILISGSGQQNRDGELFGHRPFKLLADRLTQQGFVVLRFDDLGIGESKGDLINFTTLTQADDVEFLLTYLSGHSKVNPQKIGLIGHSEGGVIAPIIAARNKEVKYVVSLAGMAIRGEELTLRQMADIKGQSVEKKNFYKDLVTIMGTGHPDQIRNDMQKRIDAYTETAIDKLTVEDTAGISRLFLPWFITFVKLDPETYLKDVHVPLLALNGAKDIQVVAKDNLEAFRKYLPNNKKNMFKEYPDLNHLFQTATTGDILEYSVIEETFNEQVIKDMLIWLNGL